MIVSAQSISREDEACDIAALLEGPALVRGGRKGDIDLEGLLHALHGSGESDRVSRTLILAESRRLRSLVAPVASPTAPAPSSQEAEVGLLLALAYPDRIAQRRGESGQRYVLANGTGAALPEWSQLSRHPYLAVGDVDGEGVEARIFLASPLVRSTIQNHFAELLVTQEELGWDDASGSVVKRKSDCLGALTLSVQTVEPSGEEATQVLLEGIARRGLRALPWSGEAESMRDRSEWLRRNGITDSSWPDLSDERLLATLPDSLVCTYG
jgi:ATP-dependent helicase HrpB